MAVTDEKSDDLVPNNPVKEDAEETREATELDKYWKAVRDNPTDFTGWTYLLQYVEQENETESAREAFDAFLARYPYCYGYWKKYADLEKKCSLDKAEEVYERGLKAIPLSIDLWLHSISFAVEKEGEGEDAETKIRNSYETAITAAGTDFRSDKLWDSYIKWEKETKDMKKVTDLYDRLLTIPTHLYSHHFENFSEHVKSNMPKDILSLDEFLKLRQELVKSKVYKVPDDTAEDDEADAPPGVDAPPGLDAPPGVDGPPGEEESVPGAVLGEKNDDEETKELREKILEKRRAVHQVTEQEVSKRWTFEEQIRRPYFHVKPLEKSQLRNWREYIDFEMTNGTHERVVVLFERCMIACALYEEFWIKYAKVMEPHSVEGVRHVFNRACTIHLPKKPNIHLAWASFEERQGNFSDAAEILANLEQNMPGLAMIALRRISLERRRGKFTETEDLYKNYIEKAESTESRSFFAIKYARYLSKVLCNALKAKTILEEALEKDENNHKLYLQLIDLEYQNSVVDELNMIKLFNKAIQSQLAIEHRVAFSQRKLEFLEDFGSSVNRTWDAYEEHQQLLKELQTLKKKKVPTATLR